jgi:molecular chaperone GrpE
MQADLEDYQKKVSDEQHESWLSGVVPLLNKVLELIDDLEQVLEIQPDRARVLTWNSQLGLIYNRLQDILKNHQVKPIEVLDKPFDPTFHQAHEIFEEFTGPDTIEICTEELKRGYKIGDQLLRPSLVRVTRSLPF